jgi:hypothetical protein
VPLFQRTRRLGPILLGAWLIAQGVLSFVPISIPLLPQAMAALAIAAGVFILIER